MGNAHPTEDIKLSGNDSKDAKRYQEKEVQNAIEKVKRNEQ